MAFPQQALPPGTRFVRLLWTDIAGLRRCRVVPASAWKGTPDEPHFTPLAVNLAEVCVSLQTLEDAPAWPASLRPLHAACMAPGTGAAVVPLGPSCPGHALVACDLMEPDPAGLRGQNYVQSLPTCPRRALVRAEAGLLGAAALKVEVGFEIEFRLLARPGAGAGAGGHAAAGPATYALASTLDAAAPILDAIVDGCAGAGIRVLQYHGESGTGAFELVTGHAPPVEAVDTLLYTRTIISSVAAAHGYGVTFAPKPSPDEAGLGAHAHLSLWEVDGSPDGVNLTAPGCSAGPARPGPADSRGASFMAGILNRLDGLLALTAGSPSSFARIQPGAWAGAHQRWGGEEDKEAPLRYVSCTRDGRFEVKCLDATANPYLALAGLIAAGLAGIKKKERLHAPAPAVGGPPLGQDRAVRAAEEGPANDGEPRPAAPADRPRPGARLPESVEATLAAFGRPEVADALSAFLSPDLLALVPAVRRADAEAAAALAATPGGADKLRAAYSRVYS